MSWWLLVIIPGGIFAYLTMGFLSYILCTKIEAVIEDWKPEYHDWRRSLHDDVEDGTLWGVMIFWWFIALVMIGAWIVHQCNKIILKIAEETKK